MKKEYSVNKYQFGTVMPGSQPVAFEYKPFGLEAFAQPIAQKQKMFDVTLDAVDNASFNIDGFDIDKESSDKLNAELVEQKNFLMQQLQETGNSKEIARRLKKLNKVYNSDAEISGIRQQKANFLAQDKIERERVDGENYTQNDYRQWREKALFDYNKKGGYKYDRSTGDHNSIDISPRGANLEKELMDKVLEIAKSAPSNSVEQYISAVQAGLTQAGFSDLDGDAIIKIKNEFKEKGKLGNEILNFVKKSDRYQNYLLEKAKYDFHDLTAGGKNLEAVNSGIGGILSMFENQISNIDKELSSSDNIDEKELEEARNNLIVAKTDFENGIKNAAEQGEDVYYKVAEKAFAEMQTSDFKEDISAAGADVYDFYKNSLSSSNTNSGTGRAAAKENIKDITEYSVDTAATTIKDGTTPVSAEVSVAIADSGLNVGALVTDINNANSLANTEEDKIVANINQNLINKENVINANSDKYDEDQEFLDKNPSQVMDDPIVAQKTSEQLDYEESIKNIEKDLKITVENNLKDTKVSHAIFNEVNDINNAIEIQNTIIEENNTKLKDPKNSVETNNKLATQILLAQRNKSNIEKLKLVEFHDLNNMVNQEMNKEGNEWMKKAFDAGDYDEVYKQSYQRNLDNLSNLTASSKDIRTQQLISNTSVKDIVSNNDNMLSNSLNTVYKDFATKNTLDQAAVPVTVMANDAANKMTNDELKKSIDFIKKTGSGKDIGARQVTFDAGTGKVDNVNALKSEDNFNLAGYNSTPVWVGESMQDGNSHQIYLYTKIDKPENIRSAILLEKGLVNNTENQNAITPEEIDEFNNNNPNNLYLSLEGTSIDILDNAKRNFTSLSKDAIVANDSFAFNTMLDSYAAIDVIANQDRRKRYLQKATTLKNALEKKDPDIIAGEVPSTWVEIGNTGVYKGHAIDYRYDKETGGIIANVSEIKADKNGRVAYDDGRDFREVATHNLTSINSQALRGLDIIYGVGNENDKVTDREGNDFVPAFSNRRNILNITNQYKNK